MAKLSLSLNRLVLLTLLASIGYLLFFKESRVNWLGFNQRERTLSQRLVETEDQVRWLGRQLRLTQKRHRQQQHQPPTIRLNEAEGGEAARSSCETVHVCIVCSGHNASRTVVTLIKSILYYRRNPLVFHFVSDHSARRVLNHLVVTWNLSSVEFIFYKAETVIQDVSWIPNKHYSGVYGLLKLTLPKVLPASLGRTIVLDTDVVFASDIGRLWNLFSKFNTDQALGLVDNQSDWYIPGKLWKHHRPWPAIGRGFNTGVILMNLEKLRSMNWWQVWRGVAENNLMTLLSTTLADQDIINTVISRQLSIVYRLPCSWNIQLSDNSLSHQLCLRRNKEVNVVHFNSPDKFKPKQTSPSSHIQFFKNLHLTFQQFDGNLLRGDFFYCNNNKNSHENSNSSNNDNNATNAAAENPPESENESNLDEKAQIDEEESLGENSCESYAAAANILYRTHIFFVPYESPADLSNTSTSLVASLSFDRLHLVESLLERWLGPVSLSLYLTDLEAVKFMDFYLNSPILSSRTNVGYHVVYKEGWSYPINFLRNVAKKYAETPFIFLSDIDFLPSKNLENNLKYHVTSIIQNGGKKFQNGRGNTIENGADKHVLIVPAFETERYRSDDLPDSKADLLKQLDVGEIITFRGRVWPQGHEATNFQKWRGSTQPYTVKWNTDFEPYIVGSTAELPDYDRRFIGFGWNKVSHIYNLHKQGYTFWVLPDVFIIHLPHTPSLDIYRFRNSAKYRQCMQLLKQNFIQETNQRYLP